jgi:hypothetical protein
LIAIEDPEDDRGRLLIFNQPADVANIVRALSTVATKRRKDVDKELGAMSPGQMIKEALNMPELRDAVVAEMSQNPEMREVLKAALGDGS